MGDFIAVMSQWWRLDYSIVMYEMYSTYQYYNSNMKHVLFKNNITSITLYTYVLNSSHFSISTVYYLLTYIST